MKLGKLKKNLIWIFEIFKTLDYVNNHECTINELLEIFPGKATTLRQYIRDLVNTGYIDRHYNDSYKKFHSKILYTLIGTEKLKHYLEEIISLIKKYILNSI